MKGCNLQLISEAEKRICSNKGTAEILQAAFTSEFTVVGSLFFEKGSMQSIYRDTPAFFTNPLNHYFGVWNALEDIEVVAMIVVLHTANVPSGIYNVCSGKSIPVRQLVEGWIADWRFSVRLNLSKLSIPTNEPLAF